MDPRSNPSDEQFAKWARRYGTTGVKTYDLTGGKNRGCVAVYREMSMTDRQLLARMETVDEEHPGAYDYQRMMVANCLLYPTLEAYPHPPFAAAELFNRIRQHGHGPLYDDEEMVTEDEKKGQVPAHIVRDMRGARKAAYDAFHGANVSSLYTDLIIELASGPNGTIDPQTLDYLWGLSPGRLRDLSARIEQAHADIRREAMQYLQQDSDMDGEEKQARAKHVENTFGSPFAPIDEVVGDAATPAPAAAKKGLKMGVKAFGKRAAKSRAYKQTTKRAKKYADEANSFTGAVDKKHMDRAVQDVSGLTSRSKIAAARQYDSDGGTDLTQFLGDVGFKGPTRLRERASRYREFRQSEAAQEKGVTEGTSDAAWYDVPGQAQGMIKHLSTYTVLERGNACRTGMRCSRYPR